MSSTTLQAALARLASPASVRARSHQLLDRVRAGESAWWRLDEGAIDAVLDFVLEHMSENYPDGVVPYHSRARHLEVGGVDRCALVRRAHDEPREGARALYDVLVVSVLLDAGAGPTWRYIEPETGEVWTRSEGLAVAAFELVRAGVLSKHGAARPWRVDAERLVALTDAELARAFQVTDENPLVGVSARAGLLRRLGQVLLERVGGADAEMARPALLLELLLRGDEEVVSAPALLAIVLDVLGPIWPGRVSLGGAELGDVWEHAAVVASLGEESEDDGLIPFHKLSQWMTYSLLEPLELLGLCVTGLDQMTGLAEYRNGGLFMDLGVLRLADPALVEREHRTDSELVIEWRALTVALLDVLHLRVLERLKVQASAFPLVRLLQGGTWSAGRVLAARLRGGAPPLRLVRDGTVF